MEMQNFSVKKGFSVVLKVMIQAMKCPFRKRSYIDISLSSLNFIFRCWRGGGCRIVLSSDNFFFWWDKVTLHSLHCTGFRNHCKYPNAIQVTRLEKLKN